MGVEQLPSLVSPSGDEPEDIGTGHPMRDLTERIAGDATAWGPDLAGLVRQFFDEVAPGWEERISDSGRESIEDALERGGPFPSPVVELGAGTGAGTRLVAERVGHVVAGDIAPAMLERMPPELASRVLLDASVMPFADRTVGTLVCVNMLLFASEFDRVLAEGGTLVWVNSIGERTPIHLSADAVSAALGDGYDVTASRAGWGTWAVARRTGS